MENAAQFGNVVGVAIQQYHSNASSGGGARNLRMRGRSGGFEDDGVRALSASGLDAGQQLLALHDAVVASINDIEAYTQFAGCLLGGGGLLDLVIVVVVSEREQEAQLFHPVDVPSAIIR